jgi:hypothetical protein
MEAGRPGISAAGAIAAAAAFTVLVGFFGVVNGFAGLIKSTYLVNALAVGNPIAYGWVALIVGVLQLLVAYPMGQPRRWALAGGAALAVASLVLTVNLLGEITAWAILLLIANVVILGLVAMFGRQAIEELGPES